MRQTLVFDADDTLWENNVLFERVIDGLPGVAGPSHARPAAIRAPCSTTSSGPTSACTATARASFLRSLRDCFERLNERPATEAEAERITELAAALVDHDVELMPGVADTLAELGTRHDLLLLTKGQTGRAATQDRRVRPGARTSAACTSWPRSGRRPTGT